MFEFENVEFEQWFECIAKGEEILSRDIPIRPGMEAAADSAAI